MNDLFAIILNKLQPKKLNKTVSDNRAKTDPKWSKVSELTEYKNMSIKQCGKSANTIASVQITAII